MIRKKRNPLGSLINYLTVQDLPSHNFALLIIDMPVEECDARKDEKRAKCLVQKNFATLLYHNLY